MTQSSEPNVPRVLIVDDNSAIHEDFRKILSPPAAGGMLAEHEASLFGDGGADCDPIAVTLDFAYQGEEGLAMVRRAVQEEEPYAMAFVDVRMPPGWDGIETTARLWEADKQLQVVICTAYTDYSWEAIIHRLGRSDSLLILKKPFDNIEVRQLTCAMTQKWRVTRELHARMNDLERIVEERTGTLEQQRQSLDQTVLKLQQAHSQLLQADKMASIGQLAAGVAHEINNPIGFISSNLNTLGQYAEDLKRLFATYDELLSASAHTPDLQAVRQTVVESRKACDFDYIVSDLDSLIAESKEGARRVRQIVADLRDFSHVGAQDVTDEDLNQIMDKTINVAWNEIKYKAEVKREYGELPAVPCFGGKLGQMFLNLLVNAAQAVRERGTITVRTGHTDDIVWAEVADTGCGIPPENVTRVFEPFFTTKQVGKGTGLGLHLAYNIAAAHGGNLTVESEVGVGTTFRVELPLSGPPKPEETRNCEFATTTS
jgi:two-component system NtrC family sensor kinase